MRSMNATNLLAAVLCLGLALVGVQATAARSQPSADEEVARLRADLTALQAQVKGVEQHLQASIQSMKAETTTLRGQVNALHAEVEKLKKGK
jgi:peptidoglycan hydrolase CwlO-like protein